MGLSRAVRGERSATGLECQCVAAFVDVPTAVTFHVGRSLEPRLHQCDVFHLDSFWQRALMWCDFEWDRARLPDPSRLLRRLRDLGFQNCAWINPYVSVQSALYQEGAGRS
jgi:alpha-D-xyloside xylohydrolase